MRSSQATCVVIRGIVAFGLILTLRITGSADQSQGLTLASLAFVNGGSIPERYTCSGDNKSPALSWTGVPKSARSIVLIVDDPDAPRGTFVHWVVYNLSATSNGLSEGVATSASVEGGEQGINGRGDNGYTGPCPPPGMPHHYHFRLYALDEKLDLKPGARAAQVEAALKGHVLASTELIGIFGRRRTAGYGS